MGGLPDDPHTDPQDRTWYGPHDRLFVDEEAEELEFHTGPEYGMFVPASLAWTSTDEVSNQIVWCWGWDGAGDLDGPDVDPIWEHMSNKSYSPEAIYVRHDRSFKL